MSSSSPFAEIHDELREVARDLLGGYSPLASGQGTSVAADWGKLAQAGWTGLEIPEPLGGAGATIAEVGVVLREMGRAVTSSPYLGTVVLGAGLLALLEPGPGRDDLLGRVADGTARVAVAVPSAEEDAGPGAPAFTLSPAGVLDGRADVVVDAAGADVLLLPAAGPGGEVSVSAIGFSETGITVTPTPVVDSTRALSSVAASAVPVAEEAMWRPAAGLDPAALTARLHERAAFALACDSLGLAEAMVETTVGYVALRHQFGRPIGSFQAVKHACADMLIQVRVGQELVAAAEEALAAGGGEDAWVAVAQAKSHVCAAAVDVAGKAMQLHGGIGYTWESGIHAYLKRAALNRSLFGSSAAHRRRLAARYR